MISTGPVVEPSRTVTVARFTGRLVTRVTPSLSVHVGGVPVGAVSSGHLDSTTVPIPYVRPSAPMVVASAIELIEK